MIQNTEDVVISQRTEMKCKECGCFSSAQWCWHCATNPLGVKYATLQAKVGEYLAYGSIDGKAERQTLRNELAELIK